MRQLACIDHAESQWQRAQRLEAFTDHFFHTLGEAKFDRSDFSLVCSVALGRPDMKPY